MENLSILQKIAIWALPVIFAITMHEVAHGWVASRFGDQTARLQGRITLNPLKHIDYIGTLLVPALMLAFTGFIFGWAKPVPVNYNNLKNPRVDSALVAGAGPLANLLMAVFWVILLRFGLMGSQSDLGIWLIYTAQAGIIINLFLMLLNFLPIPPLDGSVIVASFLKGKALYYYQRISAFGFIILLVLLVTNVLQAVLMPLFQFMVWLLLALAGISGQTFS